MPSDLRTDAEWLEADGLGGFASGAAAGPRTRRYHALLLAAATPPTGRFVLVNGLDAWVETPSGTFAISSQRYTPDVVAPDAATRIEEFTATPWPRWVFRLEDGTRVEHEVVVRPGSAAAALRWRLAAPTPGVRLAVRPFLSGRDMHALHHENAAFRFEPERGEETLTWHPYPGVPGIVAAANGDYVHDPQWYRSFLYTEERARGLDHVEDLAAPGVLRFDLSAGEAVLVLAAEGHAEPKGARVWAGEIVAAERRRRQGAGSRLERAAESYLVRRGAGATVIAGYPWFGDWGRDTFIALRGLCLASGRLDEARHILLEWAGAVSAGMLPNRFPDHGEAPEYNAVDASLWYVIAVHAYLRTAGGRVTAADRRALHDAVQAILQGYTRGTRYGIRLAEDGLLAAGEPGVQLTWMDARVGDRVVTPRIGKPVEVQALWLNALHLAGGFEGALARGRDSFRTRFWNEAGYLHDVVDPDHRPGAADGTFRPNQIFAVGGLPLRLLEGERARRVVDAVEARLWTPLGLRSLAPDAPGYRGRCEGGVRERDGAYHQGTVWPWLLGAFVDAWVHVRGGTVEAKRLARERFLAPLLRHLDEAGLGHVSEIADGDPPHTPRGCPFQAWSVGEALWLERVVLADA